MAKKDYAKLQSAAKPDATGSSSSLPALGVVMTALLCFAGGYWLGGEKTVSENSVDKSKLDAVQSRLDTKVADSTLLQAKIDELQEQVNTLLEQAKQGAHTKIGELKFYRELPEQSVTPAPVAESKPATARAMNRASTPDMPEEPPVIDQPDTTHDATGKNAYKVQLASFKTRSEAAVMQQKLMRSGVSSFVRGISLEGRGQWFRVYAGPYPDKDAARDAVKDIQQKMKIRGLLVRGR